MVAFPLSHHFVFYFLTVALDDAHIYSHPPPSRRSAFQNAVARYFAFQVKKSATPERASQWPIPPSESWACPGPVPAWVVLASSIDADNAQQAQPAIEGTVISSRRVRGRTSVSFSPFGSAVSKPAIFVVAEDPPHYPPSAKSSRWTTNNSCRQHPVLQTQHSRRPCASCE